MTDHSAIPADAAADLGTIAPPMMPAPPSLPPPLPPRTAAPKPARIIAMDFARGAALLGIFFVNAQSFAVPFAEMVGGAPAAEGTLSRVVHAFTKIFCEGKSYPLFSLLFGAGFAALYLSARARGARFTPLMIRRLGALALFGIAHIILLWPGDILLCYALCALPMILLVRLSPLILVIIGAVVMFVATIVSSAFFYLISVFPAPAAPAGALETFSAEAPFGANLRTIFQHGTGIMDPRMAELETFVFRHGPFADAAVLRLISYGYSVIFLLAVMVLTILGCFCVGVALFKSGVLRGAHPRILYLMLALGLLIGFPLQFLHFRAEFVEFGDSPIWAPLGMFAMSFGGPLVSLMYLALAVIICQYASRPANARGALASTARIAIDSIARVGKVGLTGYLLESLLMSAVMMHWGFAQFGLTTWGKRGGYVLAIYALILIFANLWTRRFALGPMEWIWRAVTYLRWPPLHLPSRQSADLPAGGTPAPPQPSEA
ncbi:DUF418 domain-containing protein [soil metagenome]